MMAVIIFCVTLVVQASLYLWSFNKQRQKIFDYLDKKETEWATERKQLLDRIQAPSFDHLKQAEVRIIKAQKEEPPVKYELV